MLKTFSSFPLLLAHESKTFDIPRGPSVAQPLPTVSAPSPTAALALALHPEKPLSEVPQRFPLLGFTHVITPAQTKGSQL